MIRVDLFQNFRNLFNVRLTGRQLGSHVCFCVQSLGICCFSWRVWRKFGLVRMHSRRTEGRSCGRPTPTGTWMLLEGPLHCLLWHHVGKLFVMFGWSPPLSLALQMPPLSTRDSITWPFAHLEIFIHRLMQRFETLTHGTRRHLKIAVVHVTTCLIREVLR